MLKNLATMFSEFLLKYFTINLVKLGYLKRFLRTFLDQKYMKILIFLAIGLQPCFEKSADFNLNNKIKLCIVVLFKF